ncbi:Malate synthase G [Dissostichus eleginoides]|uniref:Malate synthase G n=1 Tax=Dissostichus eleginoides TaxID=100907 RepID=A0AAD9F3D5_DISEL|nr:Malate synthase G [Dissostichus eleginoides]
MATKHNPDPNNPTSKEGKRMALELKHEHILAEAKKAAEERKRARSVGDTLQSPKRGCVGRGKPRGRRGGRRQGSATVTSPPTEGFLSSSVEVLHTEPSAQREFEKNMERLSDILSSCPPPEPQKSSASSWSFRQQKASERWKEARPHHLQCLLEKEAVGHPLCGLCHEPAVISSDDSAFFNGLFVAEDSATSKRLLEETASLEELKTELHCVSDDMVSTWISDVKEWASGTSETSGTSEDILQTALQQSIEGLYLSVRQRKQSLYRQNDSSKLRHRLRRKLADDKKRLNQEILKYNQLVHDSARGIDVAAVEHSLSGGSIMSALWPWEVHGMVMLTRRLQEEKGILLLEMTQHCTWLQNMPVALKNKVAEEDVDKGNGGLGCTLRRRRRREESQSGLSSPDTSEDEEGNII